jgi:hypothetical protein
VNFYNLRLCEPEANPLQKYLLRAWNIHVSKVENIKFIICVMATKAFFFAISKNILHRRNVEVREPQSFLPDLQSP